MSKPLYDETTARTNSQTAPVARLVAVWLLSARVRLAQRDYVATSSHDALENSKRLERELDAILFASDTGQVEMAL